MKTKGTVVLVSSGRGLPLQDGKVYSGAGYYLNELTVPVRALMQNGYEITFANPPGNTPQTESIYPRPCSSVGTRLSFRTIEASATAWLG